MRPYIPLISYTKAYRNKLFTLLYPIYPIYPICHNDIVIYSNNIIIKYIPYIV